MPPAWFAVALVCIVATTRSAALVHASMDTDEGLYLIMARDLLAGHLPYTLTWDCQPPGAYLVWAPFVALFGDTPVALRVGADVAVIATSLALYRVGNLSAGTERVGGLLAAAFYASMTLDSGGLGSNLEIAGAPFIAWALALGLDARPSPATDVRARRFAAIGALLGCALLIKLSLALDAAVVVAILVWHARPLARRDASLAAAGACAPIAAILAVYAAAGKLSLFGDAVIGGVVRHAASIHRVVDGSLYRRELLAFLPLTLTPFVLPFIATRIAGGVRGREAIAIGAACWFAIDVAAVWIIHEFFEHQFIPAMLPASLLAAWAVVLLCRSLSVRVALAIAAVCVVAHAFGPDSRALAIERERFAMRDPAWGDETSELAKVLVARRPGDGELFVVDDVPMFYALANVRAPTHYAFPPVFYDPQQRALTGIDTFAEMRRIFTTAPTFVIRDAGNAEDPAVRRFVDATLASNYHAVAAVKLRTLYERTRPPS